MHDTSPQDPRHGAWERIESTLTDRNDEGHTLFAEPDIALLLACQPCCSAEWCNAGVTPLLQWL